MVWPVLAVAAALAAHPEAPSLPAENGELRGVVEDVGPAGAAVTVRAFTRGRVLRVTLRCDPAGVVTNSVGADFPAAALRPGDWVELTCRAGRVVGFLGAIPGPAARGPWGAPP